MPKLAAKTVRLRTNSPILTSLSSTSPHPAPPSMSHLNKPPIFCGHRKGVLFRGGTWPETGASLALRGLFN